MRSFLLFLLLCSATPVFAQQFPTPEQICAWTGLPIEVKFSVRPSNPKEEEASGTLLAGQEYDSPKTRYAYRINLFAPHSFLRDRKDRLLEMLKDLQKSKPTGFFSEVGSHQTSQGQTYYITPGGMGPGGGSLIAFATTKRFDLVVVQVVSDEGHPLDKTHEEGPTPTKTLSQIFVTALDYFATQPKPK